MFAGVDWSGTPDAPVSTLREEIPELYLACAVCFPDREVIENQFARWHQEFGKPASFEFHGYKSAEDVLARVVEYALENASVTAVFFDKKQLVLDAEMDIFRQPSRFTVASALLILEEVLQKSSPRLIWCDEDIQSKEIRKRFNTEVKRAARRMGRTSPEVKHYPSEKAVLIQMADMVAYAIQRDARRLPLKAETRDIVRRIYRKEGNRVWEGTGDDLRPYL